MEIQKLWNTKAKVIAIIVASLGATSSFKFKFKFLREESYGNTWKN